MNRIFIVLIMICILTLGVGIGLNIQLVQYPIANVASIKTLGVSVWQNFNLTQPLTQIDWGMLEPNQSKTVICYVQNEGNTPLTLSLWTENWQPTTATDYIILSWNLEGMMLNPAEVVEAQLTLTVSPDIENITNFSFDIIISGSG